MLRGALLAFLADNLASHFVGGFKQSMSFVLRICRTCMITRDQSHKCIHEDNCTMRTPETHFEQCALLAGPLSDHYSTSYGVNRLSMIIIEEVPEFSVTRALPHDIMHDLFEGVLPKHMQLLLCYCVRKKYFTVEELNSRIHAFDFLHNTSSDIDSKICSTKSKIKQSASQMMSLSRTFPLLIGDKIPDEDEDEDKHWELFLVLLRICSIAVAPNCSPDVIAYLTTLIEEYLGKFITLYSPVKLIPKQHYMVHYPSQMIKFGPLIHAWTMRQEAKLSFIKRVSRAGNYKNVSKTVARRHQFWMCYQLLQNQYMLTPQLEISSKKVYNPLSLEDDYVQQEIELEFPGFSDDEEVRHPEWVDIQSSHFIKGAYVILDYSCCKICIMS